jgi:hypothetical protein
VQNRSDCEGCLSDYLARCGRPSTRAEWVSEWSDAGVIARELDDGAVLWAAEEDCRRRALAAVQSVGRLEALETALNQLSEAGYEHVRPNPSDEELARAASGSLLWTASGALTWSIVEDQLGRDNDPFSPKFRIFELGHWPLGMRHGLYSIF